MGNDFKPLSLENEDHITTWFPNLTRVFDAVDKDPGETLPCKDRLVDLVVKAFASRAADLALIPVFFAIVFPGRVIAVAKKLTRQCMTA